MSFVIVTLVFASTVFAPDLPSWFDAHLVLLAFVAMRTERGHLGPLVLLISFARATASLDPTLLHVVVGLTVGWSVVFVRRWLFASRLVNQMVVTFGIVAAVELASSVALTRTYPGVSVLPLWRPGLRAAALTALVAPVVFFVLDRAVFRPRFLRRGLLPVTGA